MQLFVVKGMELTYFEHKNKAKINWTCFHVQPELDVQSKWNGKH